MTSEARCPHVVADAPLAAPFAWPAVARWRRAERARLLASRRAARGVSDTEHAAKVLHVLRLLLDPPRGFDIGFYWPFAGEIDVRALVYELVSRGARAALPAVVARGLPLEFRRWQPGDPLERNALGILAPRERNVVRPNVVLVPLLGFDGANHRLGLGGGFFDRTLAARSRAPWTVGVGYESGWLPTIHPQPHDVPLDLIVTEARMQPRPRVPAPG